MHLFSAEPLQFSPRWEARKVILNMTWQGTYWRLTKSFTSRTLAKFLWNHWMHNDITAPNKKVDQNWSISSFWEPKKIPFLASEQKQLEINFFCSVMQGYIFLLQNNILPLITLLTNLLTHCKALQRQAHRLNFCSMEGETSCINPHIFSG